MAAPNTMVAESSLDPGNKYRGDVGEQGGNLNTPNPATIRQLVLAPP